MNRKELALKANTLQHAITVMQRHNNKYDGIEELSLEMFELIDKIDELDYV